MFYIFLFFGRIWQDLAVIARLLAVLAHPGNVGVPAVAAAGPVGAVRVGVSARGAGAAAQSAGLLAVGAHPGHVRVAAVAGTGPGIATGIAAVGILAI